MAYNGTAAAMGEAGGGGAGGVVGGGGGGGGGGGVRSAEKISRRVSTCAFADRIAAVSIAAYDAARAMHPDLHMPDQTVLAAIVVREEKVRGDRGRRAELGQGEGQGEGTGVRGKGAGERECNIRV